jgi:hypothetical protein
VNLCSAVLVLLPLALTPPQQRALRGPARSRQPARETLLARFTKCRCRNLLFSDAPASRPPSAWQVTSPLQRCFPVLCPPSVEFPVLAVTAQCLGIAFHTPELQAETSCVRSSCAAATCSSRRRIDPLYRQPISQLLGLVFRCQCVRRRGCRCRPPHCPFFIALYSQTLFCVAS